MDHHHSPAAAAPPGTTPAQNSNKATNKARMLVGQFAASASTAVSQWTARKYTLPDKNVASQVLMYRQLLHTACRPGLKLSRAYQATPAQVAVKHMPWWSVGIEETRKMEIAYDNLLARLWWHGAVRPWQTTAEEEQAAAVDPELPAPPVPHDYWVQRLGFQQTDPVTDFRSGGVLSLAMMVWMVESCPAVHQRFILNGNAAVLPFGITSINITDMMARFLMLSKAVDRMDALLSQKTFWRMFADPNALLACQELSMDLLADVVAELDAVRAKERDLLQQAHHGDVIFPNTSADNNKPLVTVFDFAHILAVTEKRVEHDLLGAGPGTVAELRHIHARIKARYQQQLQAKLRRMEREAGGGKDDSESESKTTSAAAATSTGDAAAATATTNSNSTTPLPPLTPVTAVLQQRAGAAAKGVGDAAKGVGSAATMFAGSLMNSIKQTPNFNPLGQRRPAEEQQQQDTTEAVLFGPSSDNGSSPAGDGTTTTPAAAAPADTTTGVTTADLLGTDTIAGTASDTTTATVAAAVDTTTATATTTTSTTSAAEDDGDWVVGTTDDLVAGATDQIGNFSIGDDDI